MANAEPAVLHTEELPCVLQARQRRCGDGAQPQAERADGGQHPVVCGEQQLSGRLSDGSGFQQRREELRRCGFRPVPHPEPGRRGGNRREPLIAAAMDKLRLKGVIPEWLVVVLKVLAYLIGLLLAGYGTSATAQTLFL